MNHRLGKTGMKTAAFLMSFCLVGSALPLQAVWAGENSGENSADKQNDKSETVGKDETVYVKLNADGTQKEVIVSDWLKNTENVKSLEDSSDLKNIKNVKGDEAYTKDDDGNILWHTDGSDIYYQGTTDKELPVSVKITYYLDGQKITPKELAGKSGKVTIRYEYKNNSKSKVVIDGKEETIATPFAVATGLILPSEHFSNVSVSGGKVISDGSNQMVAGIVFPGLKESLNLENSELAKNIELPDSLEITADAKDFQLDMSASVITGSIFEELGLSHVDGADELGDALNELSDASKQLVDGSGELLDGVAKLKDASGTFKSGIDTLYEKTGELSDGLNELNEKTGTFADGLSQLNSQKKAFTDGVASLADGAGEADDGAKALSEGVAAYTKGADSLSGGVLDYTSGADSLAQGAVAYTEGAAALNGGIGKLAASAEELPEAVNHLNEGAQQLKDGAAKLPDEETSGALKEACKSVADGVGQVNETIKALEKALESVESQESVQAVTELVRTSMTTLKNNDSQVLALLNEAKSIQGGIDSVKGLAPQAIQDKVNSLENEYAAKLETAISQLNANIALEDELVSKLAAFDEGSLDMDGLKAALKSLEWQTSKDNQDGLYAGAIKVSESVGAVLDGTEALKPGINALADGTQKLADSAAPLTEGIGALKEGGSQLVGQGEALSKGAAQVQAASKQLNDGAKALSSQSKALNAGAGQLQNGTAALHNGVMTLSGGVAALSDGVAALAEGGLLLKDGTDALADGGYQLYNGVKTLRDGGEELTDGISQLYDGALTLNDGMKEFDNDGIGQLKTVMEDELSVMADRMNAVIDAGNDYQTFTKLADGMQGSVKFIIETDGIKSEDK